MLQLPLYLQYAAVVKLVYTLVSGTSGRKLVEVQVLSAAPDKYYRDAYTASLFLFELWGFIRNSRAAIAALIWWPGACGGLHLRWLQLSVAGQPASFPESQLVRTIYLLRRR